MREKEGFHQIMEQLNEMFPDQGMLTVTEVSRFLGVSVDTVQRMRSKGSLRINAATRRITKADLARQVGV